MRNPYTVNEIVLCTYIARFGKGILTESRIAQLQNRSVSSIKMKIQNIAAMLSEEGYEISNDVSTLSGLPAGQDGRRTNWDIVRTLVNLNKSEFQKKCLNII